MQDAIYDDFLAGFTEGVTRLVVADGFTENVNVGPLIDLPGIEKVQRHVADAREHGAELLLGGERHALGPQFFEPTVMTGITEAMAMSNEETFGPVAGISRFATEEEAVGKANDTPYGLSAYFYSRDMGAHLARLRSARVRDPRHQHRRGVDRGRAVRRRQGVGHRPRGIEVRHRRVARDQVPVHGRRLS